MWIHYTIYSFTVLATLSIALLVIVTQFDKWLNYRERNWAFQLKQDSNKALSPLKISAYERLFIMLERIAPQALVLRYNNKAMNAGSLQVELIKAIREEFEHNVSLQMYVSAECWDKIKRAKEETTELIKVASMKVRPDSSTLELSKVILALDMEVGNHSINEAIRAIRLEMDKYF